MWTYKFCVGLGPWAFGFWTWGEVSQVLKFMRWWTRESTCHLGGPWSWDSVQLGKLGSSKSVTDKLNLLKSQESRLIRSVGTRTPFVFILQYIHKHVSTIWFQENRHAYAYLTIKSSRPEEKIRLWRLYSPSASLSLQGTYVLLCLYWAGWPDWLTDQFPQKWTPIFHPTALNSAMV